MKKSEIIKKYLKEHPNVPKYTLAKKIYNENKLMFSSPESIRCNIKYYKGGTGGKALMQLGDTEFLSAEKLAEKYNLPEPKIKKYVPYNISGFHKMLILSDIHFPFQDNQSIETALEYASKKKIDAILLNGDIIDFYELSHFIKEPSKVMFQEEIEIYKNFLDMLQKNFKCKIYVKFGNHEERFENYLKTKAPEIFNFPEFKLNVLLGLYERKIEYIDYRQYINSYGLSIFHGHEYKGGIIAPINPARGIFNKTKSSCLVGHFHQSSEHPENTITGKTITCWSTGCLCDLHPEYMALNKWMWGFAIQEKIENGYIIQNKKIINRMVV